MSNAISRRKFVAASVAGGLATLGSRSSRAQTDKPIKIGVLNDASSVYATLTGKGSKVAVELAIEDFGGKLLGRPIELLHSDHQNRVDLGTSIARQWLDVEGVEALFDIQTSSVTLAVLPLIAKANKIGVVSAATSSDVSGKGCTPVTFQWTYDAYALARSMPAALAKAGKTKWFLINIDNAAGASLEAELGRALAQFNCQLMGKVKAPFGSSDYTTVLLAAQSSGANVIQLGASGTDIMNELRQVKEFGIDHTAAIAATGTGVMEVHSMGLAATQGLLLTESFYWDLNDKTRAWSKRYIDRMGVPATMYQAGNYSGALHYFKAVTKAGTTDGATVARVMKSMPVDDMMSDNLQVREDGRVVREMYVLKVKSPAESKYPFDYFSVEAKVPGPDIVKPLSESECPFVKK